MNSSKPKIGMIGYFGFGNFGDELFVSTHRQYLSEHFRIEVAHDILKYPYYSESKKSQLTTFDGFLIGGGDLINPSIVSELYWNDDYLCKPIFVLGIGTTSIKRTQSAALNRLKIFFRNRNIKFISVRDHDSYNFIVSNINPALTPIRSVDPVCAAILPSCKKLTKKTMGIVLRKHRSVTEGYHHIRSAANFAKKKGYRIRLIVLGKGKIGKCDASETIKFADADEEVIESDSLEELCRAIGECQYLMSMKFHGIVIASMYGIPCVQLTPSVKSSNFLLRLQRPDLLGDYRDKKLKNFVPFEPAPIHVLLRNNLRREAINGYDSLLECMLQTYY